MVCLDNSDSVGNIQSIKVLCQFQVALFQSLGCDECVDLFAFDIVQLLNSSLDLTLVGLNVNNKDERVAILNQFHAGFGRQRVLDDGVFVDRALLWYNGAHIFGFAGVLQSFGLVKVHLGVDARALFGNALFEGLGNGCCFACNKTTRQTRYTKCEFSARTGSRIGLRETLGAAASSNIPAMIELLFRARLQ